VRGGRSESDGARSVPTATVVVSRDGAVRRVLAQVVELSRQARFLRQSPMCGAKYLDLAQGGTAHIGWSGLVLSEAGKISAAYAFRFFDYGDAYRWTIADASHGGDTPGLMQSPRTPSATGQG
jgi:hypothetical protein